MSPLPPTLLGPAIRVVDPELGSETADRGVTAPFVVVPLPGPPPGAGGGIWSGGGGAEGLRVIMPSIAATSPTGVEEETGGTAAVELKGPLWTAASLT